MNLTNAWHQIPRFPGLKIFRHGLENIKRFTADEFRNMMKVFLFIIEGMIIRFSTEKTGKYIKVIYLDRKIS